MRYAILLLMFATPAAAQSMAREFQPHGSQSGTLSFDARQRKLASCMVELSTITDPELRKWCEAQSRRLP